MSRIFGLSCPALLVLAGCGASLSDPTFGTGSATIIPSADHSALYVTNADEGTVSILDPATGAATEVMVGKEPTRIARAGSRVYVTLRGERGIAVLQEQAGGLVMVNRIATGAEPYGIVAREDGTRIYVALSQADQVDEIDTATLEVTRSFTVANHPTWLALHPSGDALYVASALGGGLTWFDLAQEVPTANTYTFPTLVGAGEDKDQDFSRRNTGDLAFRSDGNLLAIPGLYVDNITQVGAPDDGTVSSGGGYGSIGMGLSRINPGITLIDVNDHGQPTRDDGRTMFVGGFVQSDTNGNTSAVRSYLTSVTFSPDGNTVYAPMQASQTVVALSATPVYTDGSECDMCDFSDTGGSLTPVQGGFTVSPGAFIGTGAGPDGVAFLDDEHAYVHSFIDRTVASLRATDAETAISAQLKGGSAFTQTFLASSPLQVTQPSLSAQIEQGRRLFFSATNTVMAGSGSGVSCSTCHLDGRNDGLTWPLEVGGRNTPSLAGGVSQTLPVTWTSEVADVSHEAQTTSQGRMGGDGITQADLDAISAYVESLRPVDVAARTGDPAAIARGLEVFNRAEVGCGTCHSGARYTDNEGHDLYGAIGVNTPSLTGVAATAPYLHDGSLATIRDVLESARGGGMGNTGSLTDAEMADLAAYVSSL